MRIATLPVDVPGNAPGHDNYMNPQGTDGPGSLRGATMKRKLMLLERIMYVDATTPLNCVLTVKLRGDISADHLAAALAKIQRRHPLLRASIDERSEGGPYFVTNEKIGAIPVRIVPRTSDDDWLREAQQECHLRFDDEHPFARVVWLKSAEFSDLLLALPHCVCDGASLVVLMRELLKLLDDPDLPLEACESPHSIHDLLPENFTPKKTAWQAEMLSLAIRACRPLLALQAKRRHATNRNGKDYTLHWKLGENETLAISDACKRAHTSEHAALCMAFLKAFRQVRGNRARRKALCPADIRHFIPRIKRNEMFAFAPMVAVEMGKDADADIWSASRKIKDDLIARIKALDVHELLWIGEHMHAAVDTMIQSLRVTDGRHDFTFSNMGRVRIPETYRTFTVDTVYSPIVLFPWRNPNTLLSTRYRNRMDFTFISNTAFLKESDAAKIRDLAMALLRAG